MNSTVTTGMSPKSQSEMVIYHIDLFLLALICILVLIRLPRVAARFWRFSEWSNGHLLRKKPLSQHPIQHVAFNASSGPGHHDLSTDDNHTLVGSLENIQRISEKGIPIQSAYPPHIGSTVRLLRPLLKPFHTRVLPGLSFSHVCVMVAYFGALVYPAFYKTNPFTDPVRFGWITVGQYPFIILFATKNNLLGAMLGTGYEKLNFLHRFVGRLVIVSVNVHFLGYIYSWCIKGTFRQHSSHPSIYWGIIGLICMNSLYLFSLSFFRSRFYTLFVTNHILALSLLIPATILHMPACTPYVLAAVSLYGLDIFLRVVKTKFATAQLRVIPELGVTRVEILEINAGWRAGQHIRLRVCSSGMGIFGWAEVHPFTIASCQETPEGMVLMCKKAGDWTNKLYDLAQKSVALENTRLNELAAAAGLCLPGIGGKVRVMVEGPYGGPGLRMFASFSAAVFVAGGSGITFVLSAIKELIRADAKGESRVKVIELIWIVQDPSALVPMMPTLTSLVQQSVFAPLRVSVFYTRAPFGKFPFPDGAFRSTRLSLSPGRPKVESFLEAAVGRVVSIGGTGEALLNEKDKDGVNGLLVGVCGPVGLADSVFEAIAKVDDTRREQVGGIEVHEETFGW
ncbi:putative iron reductase [Moniliophthora roreri MCA 2997]|uniref:ferric-chelate reductase (NADPH) n=1 Tax=Moniliophthora roreri (strain MCA 2997) TaxID=1381753 RepID=V2YQD9_MONRO|nr:putative iron reductase [Moniliophthora roreri MCA 2997]